MTGGSARMWGVLTEPADKITSLVAWSVYNGPAPT